MYREANAWQSSFFAPQDVPGLVRLYGGKQALEKKLDSLFSLTWDGVEAYNISGFIGQYCQGNQPDHSVPFMYYFAGQQKKAQRPPPSQTSAPPSNLGAWPIGTSGFCWHRAWSR